MQDKVVIPALLIALFACLGISLKIWYTNHRARMTPEEREAEDREAESDQIW